MLAASSPQPPPRRNRTPVSISHPMQHDFSSASSSAAAAASTLKFSPPTTTPGGHHRNRPSISNPMHWLSRNNSGSVSGRQDKSIRSIEILSPQRRGVLGAGATVVRTPDEALRDSSVRLTYGDQSFEPSSLVPKSEPDVPASSSTTISKPKHHRLPSTDSLRGRLQERQLAARQQRFGAPVSQESLDEVDEVEGTVGRVEHEPITRISERPQLEVDQASIHSELPSPPYSPPLPALPLSDPNSFISEASSLSSFSMPPRELRHTPPPPPGDNTPQIPPMGPRPAPQAIAIERSTSSYSVDDFPVPPLPSTSAIPNADASVPPPAPPPAFRAILLSEIPSSAIDLSKIIITLETSTSSYRTTVDTLCSRTSHLASYLTSLLHPQEKENDAASIYSNQSDDMSTYQHHLTGLGLLSQSSFSMHLFLDRPSAPYAHILHYLRSPLGTDEHPEVLPHTVRLPSTNSYPSHFTSNSARFESLLELRDEAHFLGLDPLVELCTKELTRYSRLDSRPNPPLFVRSVSPRTVKSQLRHRQKSGTSSSSSSSSLLISRTGSIHSMQASVHSIPELDASINDKEHETTQVPAKKVVASRPPLPQELPQTPPTLAGSTPPNARSPPTPQSWLGSQRSRSQSSNGSIRRLPQQTPPAGWI
ncbi:hypothetical protein CCMSSC00406_0000950 [Pleurotus cornucopiae]|uniref:Uncharacterized protein n=1 Tax=Pleurotus cornucopiae TaxID=5321 RepID=A0ACB7IM35_PLECO|nr:hypothetical protein CCMSSC00406_0000950 [Pleurotus cornucopiae]